MVPRTTQMAGMPNCEPRVYCFYVVMRLGVIEEWNKSDISHNVLPLKIQYIQ